METFEPAGRKFIADNWQFFHPKTIEYFKRNGFSINGKRAGDGNFDSDIIDLQLGLFREVAVLPIPKETDAEISAIFLNQELMGGATNLLSRSNSYDASDFTPIAIHALMKQQLYLTYFKMRKQGYSAESPTSKVVAKAALRLILSLTLWVVAAFALAGAVEQAVSHEVVSSGLLLLLAMISGTFAHSKPSEPAEELAAFQEWRKLFFEDAPFFHIGTAHGLRFRFEWMVEQGIYVPTILFDLCTLLHNQRYEAFITRG